MSTRGPEPSSTSYFGNLSFKIAHPNPPAACPRVVRPCMSACGAAYRAKHQPECAVLPDRTWQPTTPLSQYATPCVAHLRIVADGLPPNKAHSQRRQLGKGCGYEHDGPQQRIGQRCARRAAPALPPQEGGCGGWATFQCGPDAVGRCGDYRSCFLPDRPASRRQSGAHGAQW